MGQFFETIPDNLVKWILDQKMFWVSTAPLSASGHVNVSPKGGLYFGILDDHTFWYMDLTGSGNETISHLYEPNNGRITVMFSAFEGPPRIVRLFGHGRVLESGTGPFDDFVKKHDVQTIPGSRSIIIVDVHQVGSSCGFSVPFYSFKDFRQALNENMAKRIERYEQGKSTENMPRYWASKNSWSMDGLPGLEIGRRTAKEEGIIPLAKMVGPLAQQQKTYMRGQFGIEHLLLVAILTACLTASAVLMGPVAVRRLAKAGW
ncbi:hypothetical protein QBC46DRAFT_390547 [Diplogelasinospora grovesii]|uniref:Pyridoxamine 5'-phosphate oxidase N-terminal domain-containing protein n=1 Tax=Diplogelasinospora grovesii TaxID=303347 RepID=A0AAN6S2N9_9PEZI|nr:hypothetical protein QBC46DRAFT_390547 [Diplogelasinospora grovesii]